VQADICDAVAVAEDLAGTRYGTYLAQIADEGPAA